MKIFSCISAVQWNKNKNYNKESNGCKTMLCGRPSLERLFTF